MFAIQVQISLVDDKTGEVASARHGGEPVVRKSNFFPLFDKSADGEEAMHVLYEATCKIMHVGGVFYRVGGDQKDL